MSSSSGQPPIRRMIALPALVTLIVTLARLVGEVSGLPRWLASSDVGGPGALLGITWLAPIFGVVFARRIGRTSQRPYGRLAKTLIAYGYAARIPVFLITILAILGQWGTHYEKFGPDPAQQPTFWAKVGLTAALQLVGWVFVWTLGSGMLTGSLTLLVMRRRSPAIQPTT